MKGAASKVPSRPPPLLVLPFQVGFRGPYAPTGGGFGVLESRGGTAWFIGRKERYGHDRLFGACKHHTQLPS